MSLECDEWNETAPSAGTKCEAMHLPNLSIPVECIILDWKSVAIESPAGWSVLPILHGTKFRPIRTPRERTVNLAVKVISGDDENFIAHLLNTPKDAAEKLFDAGMLRLPVQE